MMNEKIQNLLVRENLRLAPLDKRVLAWLIDTCLLVCLLMGVHFGLFKQNLHAMDYTTLRAFALDCLWQMWMLKVLYDSILVWCYGASVGKIICKIHIVTIGLVDRPNFLESFIRAVLKSTGEALMCITYIFAFGDSFSQTLHDRYVKTLVLAY